MRYLKLASAKNPSTDFIELNDLQGFLCTSFQALGISRKLEFLTIKNRQFTVDNKPNFRKYSLTIEILSKYSEYEGKHRQLISFLDRNKKDGFRLCFKPYTDMEERYCLCSIESSTRVEKMQPVVVTLVQNSLWFGSQKQAYTSQVDTNNGNVFEFANNGDGYYSAMFGVDDNIENYYCVAFFSEVTTIATLENNGYNEIPLNIKIYGNCVNPKLSLFREGEEVPIREVEIQAYIDNGYYLEINADILNNGVWYVNDTTGQRDNYARYVNNNYGSPYIYIDSGKYTVRVSDANENACFTEILYREEYSE